MAKIPRYQIDQLQSSMVGTTGVDTAAASALQTGSQALNKVGAAIYDIAETDYRLQQQELQRIQAEKRAAEKELKTLQYETNVGARKAKIGVALNELSNKKRQQYQWDTTNAMDDWTDLGGQIVEKELEGINDPKEKLMTAKALQAELSTQTQQFSDYLNSRIPDIGKANSQKIGDALRLSTNDATLTPLQVQEKLDKFSADEYNLKTFQNSFGPASESEMRKYKSDAVRNYLSQTANTGDLDLLNERIGLFKDVVEGTDTEEFYARQRSLAQQKKAEIQKVVEYTVAVETNDGLGTLRQAQVEGTLTRQMVDDYNANVKANKGSPGAIRAAEALWSQYTKSLRTEAEKALTTEEKEARRQEIIQNRKELESSYNAAVGRHKGQYGPRKGVTPLKLSELYANIDEAEIKGNISADAANTMRRNVKFALQQFNKKEPRAAQHASVLMAESDSILKQARSATPDPEVNKVFGVKLNNAYFNYIESWESRHQKLMTVEQRQRLRNELTPKMMQQAKQEVIQQKADRERRIQSRMKKK